jgi:hypothetical protein
LKFKKFIDRNGVNELLNQSRPEMKGGDIVATNHMNIEKRTMSNYLTFGHVKVV